MDSNRLIELLKFPANASLQDQEELLQLCQQYPFSAILKIINAKIAVVNQSPVSNKYISSAAIATVDRVNLQHFIKSSEWAVSTLQSDHLKTKELEEATSSLNEKSLVSEPPGTGEELSTEKQKAEEKTGREKESDLKMVQTEAGEKKVTDEKEAQQKKKIAGEAEKPKPKKDVLDEKKKIEPREKEVEKEKNVKPVTTLAKDKKLGDPARESSGEDKESPVGKETEIKSQPQPFEKPVKSEKITEQPPESKKEEISNKITDTKKDQMVEPDKMEVEEKKTEKTKKSIPSEEKTEDTTKERQETIQPESKIQEAKVVSREEKEEQGPLASDLLKNIQEYRKSREFFEKMLDENDKTEVKSSQESDKDNSAFQKSQKDDSKTHKHRKDKKNKSDSGKSNPSEKIDKKKKGTPQDLPLKKNAEKSNQETGKEIAEPLDPSNTGKEEDSEPPIKNDPATKELKTPIDAPKDPQNQAQDIPTEVPDENFIEKVTEEQKSEGYQLYEEEDPKVIKKFLDKIIGVSEGSQTVKKLKKEEQVEIIENFIKSEPKIKNIKSAQALKEREDLSLPSVKFKADIISENLANIMKSQGKTEQAIDIYKKLIWKFPQKKAYFASQIEELKKKLGK